MAHKAKTLMATNVAQQVEKSEMTEEEFLAKIKADFVAEIASHEHREKGISVPYEDIITSVKTVLEAAGINEAPVSDLKDKVVDLLAIRYAAMSNGTFEVTIRVGKKLITMPANEIKALRLKQLQHMKESKTDNFYRRIYNLGFRKEYKEWGLNGANLVWKK